MQPIVSLIMGSQSDWPTLKHTKDLLDYFGIETEVKVVSAHRSPLLMVKHAQEAETRGIKILIAGAGGAAHLPGMVASLTTLPVIGVPIQSKALQGMDSLLSIVQMPAGVPVACVAIGEAGAKNAAILALKMLAISDKSLTKKLVNYQKAQEEKVLKPWE